MNRTSSDSPRERLDVLAAQWNLSVSRVTTTEGSVLAFGTVDATPAVLKVARFPHEEWYSGEVLEAFAGHGMVRVLEHVPGAVLMEELQPATPLTQVVVEGGDDAAMDVLANVIRAMRKSPVAALPAGFPTAREWATAFDSYPGGDTGIRPDFIHDARDLYDELCATQGPARLLHGDLHQSNVLRDERRGWLAIDPKGVVAELEFEIGTVLRNPPGMPQLYTPDAMARRVYRLADALSLDVLRVVQWAFVQGVLSAIWTLEDGGRPDPDDPALRAAAAARKLIGHIA